MLERRDFFKIIGSGLAGATLARLLNNNKEDKPEEIRGIRFPAIIGAVYDDRSDKNGYLSRKEDLIGGIDIILYRMANDIPTEMLAKCTTNEDGMFYFEGLVPGNYSVHCWGGATYQGLKVNIEIFPETNIKFGGFVGLNDLSEIPSPNFTNPNPGASPFPQKDEKSG